MILIGPRNGLTAQQIAAACVAERQRLAAAAVTSTKPTLEVDAPHIVGFVAIGKGRGGRRAATPQASFHRESFAIEQCSNRARRRPADVGLPTFQPGSDLDRPPRRMRAPHCQAAFANRSCYRLRMIVGCPRLIEQTIDAIRLIPRQPLVARLTAHAEAPANHCKWLFLALNRHHKAHPFVHSTGLHPSHRQGPPLPNCDLLPMSPVCSVTDVPGLYTASEPGAGGGTGFGIRAERQAGEVHERGLANRPSDCPLAVD